MPFVDLLTSQLIVLGFAGFILLYIIIESYLIYRSGKKSTESMRSGFLPLALLGGYIFLTGLYGQFFWPLPGSYNILFYDIYPLVGLIFIGTAWAMRIKSQLRFIGILSLLLGAVAIYYGITGYDLNFTSAPIALLGLYSSFGIVGILGYPVSLMIDRAESGIKNRSIAWVAVIAIFCVFLFLGSALALFIASSAVPQHLLNTP